jgi:uncharacterized membrane protein
MSYSHILTGASATASRPVVRHIAPSDLFDALARGVDDFMAMPSHAIFLCVIYPLLGLWMIGIAVGGTMLPLAFPIAAGFALIGPLAAIGLYELSRRREAGIDSSSSHAFDVLYSPSLGAIVAMGLFLMAIFLLWLVAAEAIYIANFGYAPPGSISKFANDVFTTPAGWTLIVVGTVVGFLFAVAALSIGAISFPLLLDRGGGARDLTPRRRRKSGHHGAVGFHRCGDAADRLDPVLAGTDGGDAGSRARDLASLPTSGRARPQSASGLPAARTASSLSCGFSRRVVSDAPINRHIAEAGTSRSALREVVRLSSSRKCLSWSASSPDPRSTCSTSASASSPALPATPMRSRSSTTTCA